MTLKMVFMNISGTLGEHREELYLKQCESQAAGHFTSLALQRTYHFLKTGQ